MSVLAEAQALKAAEAPRAATAPAVQQTAQVLDFPAVPDYLNKLFAGHTKLQGYDAPPAPAEEPNDGTTSNSVAESDNTDPVTVAVMELNKDHFITLDGGKASIFREYTCPELNRPAISSMNKQSFFDLRANQLVEVTTQTTVRGKKEDKKEFLSVAKVWFTHRDRRQFINGMAMLPGRDAPEGVYNLWRGWGLEPVDGDCQPALNHIRNVICNGDDKGYAYLIGWMAYIIQHPDRQAGTAVVLRGGEGAGKGTLAQWIGRIFGLHFAHLTKAKHLVGDFNMHLRTALFTFADEALFAGDHAAASYLKALVTEDHLQVEGKGKDIITVANLIKLMMSSNSDWVVPAGADSRRYFVLDVSDRRKGDRAYFDALKTQMDNGGIAALFHYLLRFDLAGFDIRDIPDTSGLSKQRMLSMPPKSQWLFDRLNDNWFDDPISKEGVTASFAEFVQQNNIRYENVSKNSVGMFLDAVFGTELTTIDKPRPRRWGFPELSRARELFTKYAGLTHVDWQD